MDKKRHWICHRAQSALVILVWKTLPKPIERKRIPGVNTIWRESVFRTKTFIYAVIRSVSDVWSSSIWQKLQTTVCFGWADIPYNNENEDTQYLPYQLRGWKRILTLNGCNPWQGVCFFDLKPDPNNPKYPGADFKRYCHDMYMRGDTLYTADIYGSDDHLRRKGQKNPIELTNFKTPFATHNVWISDDAKYIFTTDEREGKPMLPPMTSVITQNKTAGQIQTSGHGWSWEDPT